MVEQRLLLGVLLLGEARVDHLVRDQLQCPKGAGLRRSFALFGSIWAESIFEPRWTADAAFGRQLRVFIL